MEAKGKKGKEADDGKQMGGAKYQHVCAHACLHGHIVVNFSICLVSLYLPMCRITQDNRTVFVRGVAFSVDQQPFEEAFSDVGPVKQCFLVRDKGAPKHKGCGFVQYALPEDAQRALQEMNGRMLGGRKLQKWIQASLAAHWFAHLSI
eukprot:1159328-Pelagomonas_calceolata.AAC.5